MTDYKKSYQRFLRTNAWKQTKRKVLEKRRKKWDKKGLHIDNSHFLCDRCGRIYSLTTANYHHVSYSNFFSKVGWDNPRNVIIICKYCHEWAHRKKIKRKDPVKYKQIKQRGKIK
ncbi:MAG: hypothetical protein ACFFFT_00195 [Candidatus Thorarchaeota archaeon]